MLPDKPIYPWEEQIGFPAEGVDKHRLAPLVHEACVNAIAVHAWTVMGDHWSSNQPALAELSRLQPDGCEAMARFLAKHFIRNIPQTGITEAKFWEDFCIFNLRASHNYQQDDWFKAYIQFRAARPELLPFLRRVVQACENKENPGLGDRMVFCMYWDLFILPLRYWSDQAAAELLRVSGAGFNLDKVRNTRRELGLKRVRPIVVKRFQSRPSIVRDRPEQIDVQLDDDAAKRAGLSAMLQALVAFLKGSGSAKS